MPLIAAMAANPTALAGLRQLIISNLSQCELPIDQIRAGGTTAMKALQNMEFFKPWTSPDVVFKQIDKDGSGECSHRPPLALLALIKLSPWHRPHLIISST